MKKITIIIITLVLSFSVFSNIVLATASGTEQNGSIGSLTNPLGVDDPNVLIGRVIDSILGIVGSLALLMFVYGGLTWMVAAGNQEKIKRGRDIIVWSGIGLIVVFSSYGLIRFILANIG